MNPDYEQQLETDIDRELKALPMLVAPSALISRVISAIEERTALPWFRCAWTAWPLALRAASLLTLALMFGGVCFGGWKLSHIGSAVVSQRFGGFLSLLSALSDVLLVLLAAVARVLHQLGPLSLLAYVAALTLGIMTCLGLGSLGMKVALARR